jgi:peptidoglycan hydrolase-like protein with peptidoglycan-binding domain
MNKIIFPLSPPLQGSTIADLQAALQVCLQKDGIHTQNASERDGYVVKLLSERHATSPGPGFYGEVTEKLVAMFQESQALEPTGKVDEETANRFNELLAEWGLLDQPTDPPPDLYHVKSQVLKNYL